MLWLQWYTLIFTLPAGLAILVLLLVGIGSLGGDDGAGADGDGGGIDLGEAGDAGSMDISMDADAGGFDVADGGFGLADGADSADAVDALDGADGADAGDADGDGFHAGQSVRAVLGLGNAPLTISGGGLLLGWGIAGLAALEALQPSLGSPERALPLAAAAGLVGSNVLARAVSRLYVAVVPKSESSAISRASLVGMTGHVIFPVSDTAGRIHIWDQFRTLHQEPARVAPGTPEIPRGVDVVVRGLDAQSGHLFVEPVSLPDETAAAGPSA